MSMEDLLDYLLASRYVASCLPQYAKFWDDDEEN